MIIERVSVGELEANCYIVACKSTRKAIVTDPGDEGPKIADYIDANGYHLEALVATHGHFDHIGACAYLKEQFQAQMAIHALDAGMLVDPMKNLSGMFPGLERVVAPPADVILDSDATVTAGRLSLSVVHTPGHTPGSICLVGPGVLFSGDTLFRNGVGRTDFPGGDPDMLSESLSRLVFALDDDVRIYPGHGPDTTVGRERTRGLV